MIPKLKNCLTVICFPFKVALIGTVAIVLIPACGRATHRTQGPPSSSSSASPARHLAACYGTDSYGNAELMVTADTQQQCDKFLLQLAEIVHQGVLPGGAESLSGTQCTMIAASKDKEPFSIVVGVNAPSNLCSLLSQDGYVQP